MTTVNQAATLSPPRALPNARTRMILEAPVLPTLLALAAPNLVVMLAQALANFLESYYVGLLGVDALAGAALVFPLVMLMMMMSAGGIGGGISSAVARSLGAGDQDKADALALHAVVIVGVFGLVCSAIVIGLAAPIYALLGGEGAALGAAVAYSNALFFGVVFLWLMNGLSAVLRGAGNMRLPALVMVGGVPLLWKPSSVNRGPEWQLRQPAAKKIRKPRCAAGGIARAAASSFPAARAAANASNGAGGETKVRSNASMALPTLAYAEFTSV